MKHIGAGKNRLANVLRSQGAELPLRANFSGRLGIPQNGMERHGPVVGHRVQSQFVNFKLKGRCAWFAESKLHHGTVRDDVLEDKRELLEVACRSRFVAGALTARRNEHVQTFDLDVSNPLGSSEKPQVTALDDELFDGGNRGSVSIGAAAESHAFGNTFRETF